MLVSNRIGRPLSVPAWLREGLQRQEDTKEQIPGNISQNHVSTTSKLDIMCFQREKVNAKIQNAKDPNASQ